MKEKILIAEDEKELAKAIKIILAFQRCVECLPGGNG